MFLPVLLVRDFGVWGCLAFAVPNCVGAAAMGWVLKSPGQSAELVNRHAAALRLFGLVTVAFHLFFLAWLASDRGLRFSFGEFSLRGELLIALSAVVSLLVALIPTRRIDVQGWIGLALTLGVGAVGTLWLARPDVYLKGGILPGASPASLPPMDVLYLAPVCVFGFALCPYGDLTFHRARQSLASAREGHAAFSLGFIGLFPIMIGFTLLYAGVFLSGRTNLLPLVALHIAIQAGYTVGVHVQSLRELGVSQGRIATSAASRAPAIVTTLLIAWLVSALVFALFKNRLSAAAPGSFGLGEVLYRCFMAFYGLVFPAYAWVCMIPTPANPREPDGLKHSGIGGELGRRKLLVTLGAIAAASPFYWMGFVERQTWWLTIGLGIVLLARLMTSRGAVRESTTTL